MRRKSKNQRLGSGHKICATEYRRFPRAYDYPGRVLGISTGIVNEAPTCAHFMRVKTASEGQRPVTMFWCDKTGRGWYWGADELGEHRLFNCSGDLAARIKNLPRLIVERASPVIFETTPSCQRKAAKNAGGLVR
jgi:hypothetical protein